MKTESLKFPLHAELHIRLPKGARITGVTVKDDITFLTVESEDDGQLMSDLQCLREGTFWDKHGKQMVMEEHTIFTFLENEMQNDALILIPEEDPNLRKLGVVNIVDPQSTFHVFEEIQ